MTAVISLKVSELRGRAYEEIRARRLSSRRRGPAEDIRPDDLAGDYPALQYVPPEGDYWIDILSRLGEALSYSDLEADTLDLEGVRIRVATPRMLYRMKRDTVRPQDRLDAEMLKQRFGIEED